MAAPAWFHSGAARRRRPSGAPPRRRVLALVQLVGLLLILAALGLASLAAEPPRGKVVALRVEGVIGPATADFIERGFAHAAAQKARLLVIELDTPGGLDTSMRVIVKRILAAPLPVVTFVSPEGARAASAGTFILYASHLAAMAPATNLGAASPVAIGAPGGRGDEGAAGKRKDADKPAAKPADKAEGKDGKAAGKVPSGSGASTGNVMMDKVTNDAAAYIRSLAQLRGRDPDFAERAVRDAASLSADEALRAKVIDLVARDLDALLSSLDGREVRLDSGNLVRLATRGVGIERLEPDWRNRLLSVLSNPQLALVLMMVGIYGLFFEFTSPGFGVPGVAGLICLLVALYGFHLLPVNWAGVALLIVGAILMIAESFLPSFGVLGVGGVVAFVVGGLFLIDTEVPGFGIPLPFLIGLALLSAVLLLAIGGFAVRSRQRRVVSGREDLLGALGTVTTAGAATYARIRGENWRVESAAALSPGARVRVTGLDGLTLQVEPAGEAAGPDNNNTRSSP